MGLDGSTFSESLPSGRATLNPQSTCHGPRPELKLTCWFRAGSLCAMSREHADPRTEKKQMP